jgi:hypothetical protein
MAADELTLCENCEERGSISVTDDDVDLCAECELALIDEMARHEDECSCTKEEDIDDVAHDVDCEECTCGLADRVERRKAWLQEQIEAAKTVEV